jgi:DNA-binding transcriptional ArsR family regulator
MSESKPIDTLALARRIYAAGIERQRTFPEVVFDQPAWSIMIDLYIAHHEKRLVNMFGASIGARVPQSTAHRWLEKLEDAGLVARVPSVLNGRDVLVALTPDAVARMEGLLGRIAANLEIDLPPPDESG